MLAVPVSLGLDDCFRFRQNLFSKRGAVKVGPYGRAPALRRPARVLVLRWVLGTRSSLLRYRVLMNRDDCPRLLSLAVHEFRTPVTVVAGYLRMLLKMQPGLPDQSRRLLEEAEKSCTRLASLIGELSELSNVQSGQISLDRRDVDLFALLAEVAESVQEGSDRGVRLTMRPCAQRATVMADRKYLARALESLVTATLRERAQSGDILCWTGVQHGSTPAFAFVAMAPSDDGAPHADFDPGDWAPFEEWRGGVGFRLVLAQHIVAAHEGSLFSGRGSREKAACALTLPVKESRP